MYLRTLINQALPLILALALAGCINASATNPDQPTTTPPPAAPVIITPSAPITKTLPLTGFKGITAGRSHGCIIKNSDSSLWCWGNNAKGQVGIDNTADASDFRAIGQDNLWQNISAGYSHTCGVAIFQATDPADATQKLPLNRIYCFGDNSTGAIGYGTPVPTYFTPILIEDDDWASVSAGNNHSCAIRLDKTLWCWGDNRHSQLGHISATETRPSQVNAGLDNNKNWRSISASDQFTCALKENNSLWCWGKNDQSQFGNGTTANATTPLQVGTDTDWSSMATGQAHTCALKTNNKLYCWGNNSHGQIGNGTIINETTPFLVRANNGAIADWSAVATGHQHTCAIALSDKSLWCWGNNETGQLGINSTAHQSRPIKINHATSWLLITAGESHSCAVNKDDIVHCWGFNDHGQLANGYSTSTERPRTFDTSPNWSSIATGYHHSCGLKGSAAPYTLWCGGFNNYGQIGIASTSNQATLVQIRANNGTIITGWQSLSVGPNHSCAVAINGANRSLFCWGNNNRGQLADSVTLGNVPQHWWPNSTTQIVVGMEDWSMVAAGTNNSCGIKGVNELWCWGDNSAGQIANGTINLPSDPPFAPTKINGSWLTVSVGGAESGGGHICAIKTDGTLWCWGNNDKSQLGNTTTAPAPTNLATPNKVNNDTNWIAVKAGERHSCALKSDSTLWCWGDNSRGQTAAPQVTITDPNDATKTITIYPPTVTAPVRESANYRWLNFGTGSNFSCAVRDDRTLWCWGDNLYKQLTSEITGPEIFIPRQAHSSPEWLQVTLGQRHGCAIRENAETFSRSALCWGEGAAHQYGNGNAWKITPQPLSLE